MNLETDFLLPSVLLFTLMVLGALMARHLERRQ